MRILSFDTSGADTEIALLKDGAVLFEQRIAPSEKNRQEAASRLLPLIDDSLKSRGWQKSEIDLIVVGVGPGSFTGLRVAVIAARSIGQALGIGVVPVNRLELLAFRCGRPCGVILDAGAGKLYAAAYGQNSESGEANRLLEPCCSSAEKLTEALAEVDNLILEPGLITTELANGKKLLPFPSEGNSAADAALLACSRTCTSLGLSGREALARAYPWDNVLPLYLRSPSVTLKAGNGSKNQSTVGT